jgi:hypothetical protein
MSRDKEGRDRELFDIWVCRHRAAYAALTSDDSMLTMLAHFCGLTGAWLTQLGTHPDARKIFAGLPECV